MNKKSITKLRQKYPYHVPLKVAGEMLGVSERRLSSLIAEGRKPFSEIGANIGVGQKYIRIYTERLIAYLNGDALPEIGEEEFNAKAKPIKPNRTLG